MESVMDPERFLDHLYGLAAAPPESFQKEDALDFIFWEFDRWLCADAPAIVDGILAAVDLARLPSPLIVGLLVASRPAAPRLPARPAFVLRARERLISLVGAERAHLLTARHFSTK